MKLILWHGSDRPLERFSAVGPDRALHLGTRAQAEMRNRAFLHEVEVEVSRVRRSPDAGTGPDESGPPGPPGSTRSST